jgi:transposase
MLAVTPHRRYYLYREPVNINKSFYRLAGIVRDQMQGNPLTTDVFIFLNRKCTQIKLLSWEGDGFGIYHRRLEKGTFESKPPSIPSIALKFPHFNLVVKITP